MKLQSLINKKGKHAFSEEELLRFENDFLRAELEINELVNSIELMETIKACIEKEGAVSSSIETMFGENFSSKENLVAELDAALEKAYEGLGEKIRELTAEGKDAALDAAANSIKEKLKGLSATDLEKVSYPVNVVEGHWMHRMDEASHLVRNLIADDKVLKETKGMDFIKKIKELVPKYKGVVEKIKEGSMNFGRIIQLTSAANLKEYIDDLVKALDEYPSMNRLANEAKQEFKDIIEIAESFMGEDAAQIKDAKQGIMMFETAGKRVIYMAVHLMLKSQIMAGKKILAAVGGKAE